MQTFKNILSLFFSFSCFALTACNDVETPDGQVPTEYLSQAQALVGEYRGVFKGVATTLVISMIGQRPTVTVQNSNNNDLYGADCRSHIGQLQKFGVSDNRLSHAQFAFAPGYCLIPATDVALRFQDNNYFELKLLESERWVEECTGIGGVNEIKDENPMHVYREMDLYALNTPPPPAPKPGCRWVMKQEHIFGTFTRR